MGYRDTEMSSGRRTRWLIFILIMLILVIALCLLAWAVRKGGQVSDKRHPVYEGVLDYETGHYLKEQDYFFIRFDTLLETGYETHGAGEAEAGEKSEWQVNFDILKSGVRYMQKFEVAEPFLPYKEEIDGEFSRAISAIEHMLESGSYDKNRLMDMRLALEEFVAERSERLPAMLDAVNVEYTFETDENGNEVLKYYYTDTIMIP